MHCSVGFEFGDNLLRAGFQLPIEQGSPNAMVDWVVGWPKVLRQVNNRLIEAVHEKHGVERDAQGNLRKVQRAEQDC